MCSDTLGDDRACVTSIRRELLLLCSSSASLGDVGAEEEGAGVTSTRLVLVHFGNSGDDEAIGCDRGSSVLFGGGVGTASGLLGGSGEVKSIVTDIGVGVGDGIGVSSEGGVSSILVLFGGSGGVSFSHFDIGLCVRVCVGLRVVVESNSFDS